MKKEILDEGPVFYGSVVVGERGQIVIPAEARRDLGLAPGDKLIILGSPQGAGLMVTKADNMLKLMSQMMERVSQIESIMKADAASDDEKSGGER